MVFAILLAAAASAPHARVNAEQAREAGYAQAQAALAGTDQPVAAQVAPVAMPAVAAAQQPSAVGGMRPLTLTCGGAGTANKMTAATAYTNGSASGMVGTMPVSAYGSATTTIYGTRQQGFEDQVDVRLFSGDDRIRLPRTMLPVLHGGSDGWFKLKDVRADARAIRASAAVNIINNPKVYIDRVTGTISISGKAGDYSGECQVIDASTAPKF